MRFHHIALTVACALLLLPAQARSERPDSIRYRAEVATTLSSGSFTPLWLNANKFGFSSTERNNVWLRLSASKDLDKERRFSWGAGIDMGVAHRLQSTFMPQQLYGEVQYRCLDAMLGAKELDDGFLNRELSSGSLTQGWNARPIPQLRIGIFDYAGFWGCNDWFAVKGHLAYGAMTDDWWLKRWVNPEYQYTKGTLYASRAIYFRGGDARRFPLEGELGLVMDTQFGGKTWYPDSKGGGKGEWHTHPHDLKAWIKAMLPMKGGSDNANAGERANVEGNFLGNWSMSLKWEDPRGWMARIYYQHFFEDHSMLFFDYPWKDGLYGVEGRLPAYPVVTGIVYEFLYMRDQSSPVYWDHTPTIDYQISGRDQYYNHYIYNGWQHWGQGIANPLITAPLYNADHSMVFRSTRIVSHHLGIQGDPGTAVSYRLLASHTKSWGTYRNPFPKPEANFSMLAEVKYHPIRLKGWEASLSVALDHGSLLGNSFGASLSISKSGFLKF